METGDCGLMFLAEEPADKDETGRKKRVCVLEIRALSNQAGVFSPVG